MNALIGIALVVMGLAIAGVWTRDIASGEQVDRSQGLVRARDPDAGTLFLPHWIAEYATAMGLAIAGIGLVADTSWSGVAAGVASGALLYTSTNSLGWALAEPERRAYAVPMALGVIVSIGAIGYVLTRG